MKPKESDCGKGAKDLKVPKRASLIDIREFEAPEGSRFVENSKQYAKLKRKDIESWAEMNMRTRSSINNLNKPLTQCQLLHLKENIYHKEKMETL